MLTLSCHYTEKKKECPYSLGFYDFIQFLNLFNELQFFILSREYHSESYLSFLSQNEWPPNENYKQDSVFRILLLFSQELIHILI